MLTKTITYRAGSNQIASYTVTANGYSVTYTYTYDDNGNITAIGDGTNYLTYVYDSQNQLIRENNEPLSRTYLWSYDDGGNIVSYETYEYTSGTPTTLLSSAASTYTDASWGDMMSTYGGSALEFDEIGNLLGVVGGVSYTWEHGRQLAALGSWTYTYDANGMRTGRSSGSNVYSYVYNGSKLSQMTDNGIVMNFTYDAAGTPLTIEYNGTLYYYVTNLQGDVVGILDGSGNLVVQYFYNAWGYIMRQTGSLSSTLGNQNPLRYRGYVYDHNMGLYYLESRYYNPGLGRFQNADAFASTGQGLTGNNMYAYCGNNPVIREDESGEFWNVVIGAAVGGLVSGVISFATQVIENQGFNNINWACVGIATAAGAVSGAFAATGIPVAGQVLINAAVGAVSSVADTYAEKGKNATATDYLTSAATGGVLGAVGGFLGGNGTGTKHLSKSAGRLLKKAGSALGDVLDNGIKATGHTILKAGKYYYSQIVKQSMQCGKNAISPIIVSNIPNA